MSVVCTPHERSDPSLTSHPSRLEEPQPRPVSFKDPLLITMVVQPGLETTQWK